MMKEFDLKKRTTNFAKAVVRLCKSLRRSPINDRLISQLVGASGSVGANTENASEISSLLSEAEELKKILSAIINKAE